MAKLATRSEKLVASGPNPVAMATPQVATSSPAVKKDDGVMDQGKNLVCSTEGGTLCLRGSWGNRKLAMNIHETDFEIARGLAGLS